MSFGSLDVMVVAARADMDLASNCLRSLTKHLPQVGAVRLVTNAVTDGLRVADEVGLPDVEVIADEELLSPSEQKLPGWYRQQVLKLRAGSVLSGDMFAVMSGDTWLLRSLEGSELAAPDGRPYLQVNRYRYASPHLAYEQQRVDAVASLLGVEPGRSRELGDFICDFFCFERELLDLTLDRLAQMHGANWTRILDGRGTTLSDMTMFGEYTTYAVAALELAERPPPVRIGEESHVLQIHSRRSLGHATFEAPILHLVDKSIPLGDVEAAIERSRQAASNSQGDVV